MNVHEIMQGDKARAVLFCTNKRQREIAEALLVELVAEAFKVGKEEGDKEGGQYVLDYLTSLYEGVEDTDVYAEYYEVEPEAELVCDECGQTFKESEGEDATAFGLKFLCDDDYDKWHKDSLELLRSHTKEGE
jgi:hypothetical protein